MNTVKLDFSKGAHPLEDYKTVRYYACKLHITLQLFLVTNYTTCVCKYIT